MILPTARCGERVPSLPGRRHRSDADYLRETRSCRGRLPSASQMCEPDVCDLLRLVSIPRRKTSVRFSSYFARTVDKHDVLERSTDVKDHITRRALDCIPLFAYDFRRSALVRGASSARRQRTTIPPGKMTFVALSPMSCFSRFHFTERCFLSAASSLPSFSFRSRRSLAIDKFSPKEFLRWHAVVLFYACVGTRTRERRRETERQTEMKLTAPELD